MNYSEDTRMQVFEREAKVIEERHREFFDNHPLNTEEEKYDILKHCLFENEDGNMYFTVDASTYLPSEITKELVALFQRIYGG